MYARTRQIVETSMQTTSTAHMKVNRTGVNVLYPPVGQSAVAAAEASASSVILLSAAAFSATAIAVSAHGEDEGDTEVVDVDEVVEPRRAVA